VVERDGADDADCIQWSFSQHFVIVIINARNVEPFCCLLRPLSTASAYCRYFDAL
jgi:hypothetical protein